MVWHLCVYMRIFLFVVATTVTGRQSDKFVIYVCRAVYFVSYISPSQSYCKAILFKPSSVINCYEHVVISAYIACNSGNYKANLTMLAFTEL